MRADLRRARDQKSTSSHGAGATFWIGLALCAVLAAAGCKGANFAKPDGGGGRDGNASDVAQPNTCPPEIPSQSKGKAQSCSCDRECQTGFCVDGICCREACTETCKACDLASSLGDCAFVPLGVKPSVALQCVASSPATCGLDGTCDGKGGCSKFEKGAPCRAGTCDGDGVTGSLTCDGNGNCSDPISLPCAPYTCDPTTSDCARDCTTDAQCSPGHQCVSGLCGKSPNGAFCDTADRCSSGFCVDGVCCNRACSSCMSCNQTGSVGHCAAIPAGQHDPACGGGDPTTCRNTGVCDGFGSCTLYPKDTVCGPSSCSGLVENTPRTCDGQGTCGSSQPLDCSPYLCTNGACAPCKLDSDCAPGNQCVLQTVNGVTTGSCGKKPNGQPCANPSECLSSQCVDGVCCENSCAGACQSCNLPSSPGRCLNVASNAPDQHKICQDLGATSCSTNGLCDGNGACQDYPAATPCSQETCVAGLHTPASQCDGSGKCVPSDPIGCDPYVCNGPTCYKSCTSSSIQCISGKFCTNASCGPKLGGAECSVGTECLSTFCAQGACCDSACLGACMECNLKAAPGHCTAVADKSQDPQNICTAKSSDTCSTTGTCLSGKCALFDKGTNCKAASCATTSSVTPASTCDGTGSCVQPAVVTCTNQTCVSGSCQGVCGPPGEVQCLGNGVQTCGATGNWSAAVPCKSSACQGGACTGLCTPGDKQCSGGTGIETCGSSGQWPKPVPCATGYLCTSAGDAGADTCASSCTVANQKTNCDTGAGYACSSTGTCKKAPGQSCAVDVDCGSGYVCNQSGPSGVCCNKTTTECNDGLACTTDSCTSTPGTCTNTPTNGNCAIGGACYAGGTTNPTNQCQQCTVATSQTAWTLKPTGTACDDGNANTVGDVCTNGTCAGVDHCIGVTCPAPAACHLAGTCINHTTGACSNPTQTDGMGCDDGNACTQNDVCTGGVCGGTSYFCPAPDQCHQGTGTCNGDGTCSFANQLDGTTCNDGNACTNPDTCQGGSCVPGPAVDCGGPACVPPTGCPL